MGGLGNFRMLCQTKVVVGAEIEHGLSVRDSNTGALWGRDDPLIFVGAGFLYLGEFFLEVFFYRVHTKFYFQSRIILPEFPLSISSKAF